MAARAVLEKAFVPLLQFVVVEFGLLAKIVEHFGLQLAVLFAHVAWKSGGLVRVRGLL